eukprot:3941631-Rhodomonas_salina.3
MAGSGHVIAARGTGTAARGGRRFQVVVDACAAPVLSDVRGTVTGRGTACGTAPSCTAAVPVAVQRLRVWYCRVRMGYA